MAGQGVPSSGPWVAEAGVEQSGFSQAGCSSQHLRAWDDARMIPAGTEGGRPSGQTWQGAQQNSWWDGAGPQGSRPGSPAEASVGLAHHEEWNRLAVRAEPGPTRAQEGRAACSRRLWSSVGRCGPVNGLGGGAVRLWGGPAGLELEARLCAAQGEAGPLHRWRWPRTQEWATGVLLALVGGPPASSHGFSLCSSRSGCGRVPRPWRWGAACESSPRPGE